MKIPDLAGYDLHRTAEDAEFEGVAVPGLTARFYRRPAGRRIASVGHYTYAGRELLLAWGYVDEEHCRASAVRGADGWEPATRGCPTVRVRRAGGDADGPVAGFAVRDRRGRWIGDPGTDSTGPDTRTRPGSARSGSAPTAGPARGSRGPG
ncbi:hypothetical protein GCM10010123_20720 [Pilimelia anulata]|uniref:Uncharacterized protein n=1 Tax=Pilimelia anulata TaxID=53371 RepID=A0A8J3BAK3_9ACTN|nr:hypothetical protein [Pilimelia anulata]GGJ90699.1 hypothetical protein GCM10010123_20720 [Pilimelia anulata]